jgi:hypothetical protein
VLLPPRTRVEETVLDLIDRARSFDEAYAWICRAIGRRRTTAARIEAALAARPRIQRRPEVELALGYAKGGVLSVLELRYVRGVERAHGLPAATRQARVRQAGGNRYLDNLYPEYGACVEIDGTAAHPADEQWRDKNRDRWNAVHEGIATIRVGVPDLINRERQCLTAADVAKWLSGRALESDARAGRTARLGYRGYIRLHRGCKYTQSFAAATGGAEDPSGGEGGAGEGLGSVRG